MSIVPDVSVVTSEMLIIARNHLGFFCYWCLIVFRTPKEAVIETMTYSTHKRPPHTVSTFFNTLVCMLGKVTSYHFLQMSSYLFYLQGVSMLLCPFFVVTQLSSCTSPGRDGFVPQQQESRISPAAVQPRFPQVCCVKLCSHAFTW